MTVFDICYLPLVRKQHYRSYTGTNLPWPCSRPRLTSLDLTTPVDPSRTSTRTAKTTRRICLGSSPPWQPSWWEWPSSSFWQLSWSSRWRWVQPPGGTGLLHLLPKPHPLTDLLVSGCEPCHWYSFLLFTFIPGRPEPAGSASDQLTIREALESQGDLPLLVITVAAVVGTVLLLLNIILIGCFIHKKNKNKAKKQQRAPSSEGKTKTNLRQQLSIWWWWVITSCSGGEPLNNNTSATNMKTLVEKRSCCYSYQLCSHHLTPCPLYH